MSSDIPVKAHVNEVRVIQNGKAFPLTDCCDEIMVEECATESKDEMESTLGTKSVEKDKNVLENNSTNAKGKALKNNIIPYPAALIEPLKKPNGKQRPQSDKIWDVFKHLKINLPLIDAIKKVPSHAKHLKDLCTQKRQHKFSKKPDQTAHVSAVFSNHLPPKLKDPGAPCIEIQVGDFRIKKALLDLGASVNILPGSLYDQHDFGPLQKTNTTVVLADLSLKLPRGVLKDVIVKVEDFYYPVDFLVLDSESSHQDKQPNVILGRPFLATINAQISCRDGSVDVTFGNRKLRLNVFSDLSNSNDEHNCFYLDVLDECAFPLTICGCEKHTTEFGPFVDRHLEKLMEQTTQEESTKVVSNVGDYKPPWTNNVRVKMRAYEHLSVRKSEMTTFHNAKIPVKKFKVGQKFWSYRAKIKYFREKIKNKWFDPFGIKRAENFRDAEVADLEKQWKQVVNAHTNMVELEEFSPNPLTYLED